MIWPLTPLGTGLVLLGVAIGLWLTACSTPIRPDLHCVEISETPRWEHDCRRGYETYHRVADEITRYRCCPLARPS